MAQLNDDCFAPAEPGAGASQPEPLLSLEAALALLRQKLSCLVTAEELPLRASLGRVLAEDLLAPLDVPGHDNSAVDGFAVHFDDLDPQGETRLPLAGRAAAGHPFHGRQRRGTALRIFTGAPMPDGADTVMMQEDCRLEGEVVVIAPGIRRGANRRRRGEDLACGQLALRAGRRLRPQDLGQAAATGRASLQVYRPLRVALFSTGDELIEPARRLAPGAIYDSNRYTLAALLTALGCNVTDLGILEDRREAIEQALAGAAERHDVILTSGGVSVGEEDHVKQAVESLGRLHLWRLAIKPGRPIAFGQIGTTPFIGLPGNPAAVVVTFVKLVRPALLLLMGADAEPPPLTFPVTSGFSYAKKRRRQEWLRVSLEREPGGGWRAVKFPRDGAGILSSLVETDGLLELPEELVQIERGTTVDFLPFSEVLR